MPTAFVAGDAEHHQLADNVAERDRAFAGHRSNLSRIVPNDSRVVVPWEQCHQRCGVRVGVCGHPLSASIAVCHPGFASYPAWAVIPRWPQRQRFARRIGQVLEQSQTVERNIIRRTSTRVRRNPRLGQRGELQYRCNRCLCFHPCIVTHLPSAIAVPWCRPQHPANHLK
jgi:hypothetical protein